MNLYRLVYLFVIAFILSEKSLGDSLMKFVRTLNNSAAIVEDDGKEEVVLGKGIGFGLKKGDQVDESKIERRFVTADDQDLDQVKDIRSTTLDVTNKVVDLVEPLLQIKFNDYQYLALADHIDFAVTRIKDHIDVSDNNTSWEVKNLFPKEYRISQRVIDLINNELKIELPKSEAVFMTYHLVNASSDEDKVQETVQITNLISGIINIVQLEYQMVLDTNSFNYNRFITHLRALLVRLIRHQKTDTAELDPSLLGFMKVKYSHAYETAERIATYLHSKMGWKLQPDDIFYLVLHIFRVTSRQDKN